VELRNLRRDSMGLPPLMRLAPFLDDATASPGLVSSTGRAIYQASAGSTRGSFHETDQCVQGRTRSTDHVLRSRAKHGVSKDGNGYGLAGRRPSRRAQVRASSGRGCFDDIDMIRISETVYSISSGDAVAAWDYAGAHRSAPFGSIGKAYRCS